MAYGGSQDRGQIVATTAGPSYCRSNVRSELSLQPTPQLTAMSEARDRTCILMDPSRILSSLSHEGNFLGTTPTAPSMEEITANNS